MIFALKHVTAVYALKIITWIYGSVNDALSVSAKCVSIVGCSCAVRELERHHMGWYD